MRTSDIFGSSFPSFENEYKRQKQENDLRKKIANDMFLKSKLKEVHPDVIFEDLRSEEDPSDDEDLIISYDDGCTRYRNKKTKKIYLWDFQSKKWRQNFGQYSPKIKNLP